MAFALILLGTALGLIVSAMAALTLGAGPIAALLIFWTTGIATIFGLAIICGMTDSERHAGDGEALRLGAEQRGQSTADTA